MTINVVFVVLSWNDVRSYGETVLGVCDTPEKAVDLVKKSSVNRAIKACTREYSYCSWEFENDCENGFIIRRFDVI